MPESDINKIYTHSISLRTFENYINIIHRVLKNIINNINYCIKKIKQNIYKTSCDNINFYDKDWLAKLKEITDYLDTLKIIKGTKSETETLILKYISDSQNKVYQCKLHLKYYLLNKSYFIEYREYYKRLIKHANLRLYANLDDLGKPIFKCHNENLSAFYKKEKIKQQLKEFEIKFF